MGTDFLVLTSGRAVAELCVAVQTLQFNAAREKERGITLSVGFPQLLPTLWEITFLRGRWSSLVSTESTTARGVGQQAVGFQAANVPRHCPSVLEEGERNGCELVLMVK